MPLRQVTLPLNLQTRGRSWDDFGVVYLWCVIICNAAVLTAQHECSERRSTTLIPPCALPCGSPAYERQWRRCIDFNANFGQVELRAAAPAAGLAAAAAAPLVQRSGPPPAPPPLENCAPLTGRFRAHWQVSGRGIDSLQGQRQCLAASQCAHVDARPAA